MFTGLLGTFPSLTVQKNPFTNSLEKYAAEDGDVVFIF